MNLVFKISLADVYLFMFSQMKMGNIKRIFKFQKKKKKKRKSEIL